MMKSTHPRSASGAPPQGGTASGPAQPDPRRSLDDAAPLLSLRDLRVAFRMGKVDGVVQRVQAVGRGDVGVSFDIATNRTVALVGESGSGKSVTAMSILNLLPDNAERGGSILYQGREMLKATSAELRSLRGREIACVFQDPMSSLNPVLSVGAQLCEPLMTHLKLGARAAWQRAEALLNEVGMPEAKRRLYAYPHELSGGQQQRVMIAMALACEPKLLIADEPTTALDVTIQRQILELLATLKAKHGMSLLFISHDLGVVGEIADEVVVMREGTVRERGRGGADLRRAARRLHPGVAGLPAEPAAQPGAADGHRRAHRRAIGARAGAGQGRRCAGAAGGALAGQVLLAAPGRVRQSASSRPCSASASSSARPHAGRGR